MTPKHSAVCCMCKEAGKPGYSGLRFVCVDCIEKSARAHDVMMRLGWTARRGGAWGDHADDWCVLDKEGTLVWCGDTIQWHADPFTALDEADKWHRENVATGEELRHEAE